MALRELLLAASVITGSPILHSCIESFEGQQGQIAVVVRSSEINGNNGHIYMAGDQTETYLTLKAISSGAQDKPAERTAPEPNFDRNIPDPINEEEPNRIVRRIAKK